MVCEIVAEKTVRFVCVENGIPATYLLKVPSKEDAQNFYSNIVKNF